MNFEDNKIALNKKEIELLQNVVEIAIASPNCNEEERDVAVHMSAMLDDMCTAQRYANSVYTGQKVTLYDVLDLMRSSALVNISQISNAEYDWGAQTEIYNGDVIHAHGNMLKKEVVDMRAIKSVIYITLKEL